MSLIRCLLLDDEPIARQVLRTYAERLPFLQVAGECANALEAYEFLRQHEVDLIFCDIEMPQISGLDFLKALPHRPLVVLTTAYEQYALAGFELDVVDYLLKPAAFDRFWRAIEKVKDRLALRQLKAAPATAPASAPPEAKPTPAADDFIMIKENGNLVKVALPAIRYIEAMKDYVKIFTAERRLVAYLTMKKLEETLPAAQFTRVHKSYIVRNDGIETLQGNMLELKSKVQIPVGVQFREAVLRVLHEHLVRR
ncbi:LytTR family DNA-binding domain-containing protein [Hymenobacter sp.]|jgi:DNA-binding LytR/AlgR family response regulator|uniref:LytR/AlgR family response regulator transcription factor n=1 Tax=Hymenobacter sp. TaxID=1898978 RepID=UPI002EDB8237